MCGTGDSGEKSDFSSNCSGADPSDSMLMKPPKKPTFDICKFRKSELALLDLYSGCGGMSTGLCLGAKAAGINLVTASILHESIVRNEKVDDFLELLKEWSKLCSKYVSSASESHKVNPRSSKLEPPKLKTCNDRSPKEYEVLHIEDICFDVLIHCLLLCRWLKDANLKVLRFLNRLLLMGNRMAGEEAAALPDRISTNVNHVIFRSLLDYCPNDVVLQLPIKILSWGSFPWFKHQQGDVDVICGGPPCQGISGYNRFRNTDAPLDDERNQQIVVFMDTVQYLKPKYVLMENVVDILRFAKGTLGRYALSRLIEMRYQARLGIMAASCYGKLPQFPLPNHDAILKGNSPVEFERNLVGYDEGQPRIWKKHLFLKIFCRIFHQ
ncbi:DNA (cytosine-5)-methyltransferase CMT2 [Platanthera guangdongensis]|uniref:DNA (cytosine-5-)-methyltransferase n=1 Tax=Platanthera guangdongensis TaxID=2320717 RepID=A0ABR2MNP8_9ASPA